MVIFLLGGCKTGELRFIKGVAEGQIKPVRKIEKLTFYQSLQRSSKIIGISMLAFESGGLFNLHVSKIIASIDRILFASFCSFLGFTMFCGY